MFGLLLGWPSAATGAAAIDAAVRSHKAGRCMVFSRSMTDGYPSRPRPATQIAQEIAGAAKENRVISIACESGAVLRQIG